MNSDEQLREPAARVRVRNVRLFQARLLDWFSCSARNFPWRKRHASVYHKILAEVLLQRTRADVVSGFLPAFLERFPSWAKLAHASEKELGTFLQPLGLWRRKATSLKKLAAELAPRKGCFPRNRVEIESLPGVGQYIANAVMLFCHGEAEPLLDVNMARVLERYFGPRTLVDIRYDPYLQNLARRVLRSTDAVSLNWAILDLAALICVSRKPRCGEGPLAAGCLHGRKVLGGIKESVISLPGSGPLQCVVRG
jgi:A/G-specific adenine glycosylase